MSVLTYIPICSPPVFSLSASLPASVNFDFVIAVALIKVTRHYDFDLEFSDDE